MRRGSDWCNLSQRSPKGIHIVYTVYRKYWHETVDKYHFFQHAEFLVGEISGAIILLNPSYVINIAEKQCFGCSSKWKY